MELNAISIGFVVFAIFTLGGALGVVTTRNLFQGTIWLMVSLFGVAGYFVLLSAPFLAAVQILVYIGAIAILITFAVMLTRSIARIKERYIRTLPSFIASLALFLILLLGVTFPLGAQQARMIHDGSPANDAAEVRQHRPHLGGRCRDSQRGGGVAHAGHPSPGAINCRADWHLFRQFWRGATRLRY